MAHRLAAPYGAETAQTNERANVLGQQGLTVLLLVSWLAVGNCWLSIAPFVRRCVRQSTARRLLRTIPAASPTSSAAMSQQRKRTTRHTTNHPRGWPGYLHTTEGTHRHTDTRTRHLRRTRKHTRTVGGRAGDSKGARPVGPTATRHRAVCPLFPRPLAVNGATLRGASVVKLHGTVRRHTILAAVDGGN